jgi:Uma2 family endonuclease
MPSPIRRAHAKAYSVVLIFLGQYALAQKDLEVLDNATVILDGDNEVQPDVLLRKVEGGSSRVNDEDYVVGPPELIVEIASSSAAYDLYEKRNAYRRNGVQEYMVWTLHENAIHWFRLHEGRYVQVEPDDTGVIRSQVFPGLWLNVPALLRHDLPTVLATLQAGMDAQQRSGPGGPGAAAASTEDAAE